MSEITDQEVFDRLPGMVIDRDSVDFYRGVLERRMLLNHCEDCGHWNSATRPQVCPTCWSDNVTRSEPSGKGTIHSFTLLHAGLPIPGVDYKAGYPVALVELDEQKGFRAAATIVDCPNEDLRVGLPVELTWIERGGEPFPAFRPQAAA